jgi:alcohol dehydrogenase
VPDAIDDITAVFIEPVAAACRVVEQVDVRGTRAAVVGAGRLGLLVAQVLRDHGADVTAIIRSERSRSIAGALGFEAVTNDVAVASLGRGCDLVVDATGSPAGLATALALTRPRGALVVKSTFHGETRIAFSSVVVDEISLIGSRCGPFDRAIELLAGGQIAVKPLVAGVYPLEQFAAAFEESKRGLKVIFGATEKKGTDPLFPDSVIAPV